MMTLMITGVSGVGKSTLSRIAAESLQLEWGDYADLMLQVMNETDKDMIQQLTWDKRRKIYDEVETLIERTFTPAEGDKIFYVFENHLTIIQDSRIVSFPAADYTKYNMAGLVVIEAAPDVIVQRRQRDETRSRHIEDATTIRAQQDRNRTEALKISEALRVPLIRLDNPPDRLPVTQLLCWMKELMKVGK